MNEELIEKLRKCGCAGVTNANCADLNQETAQEIIDIVQSKDKARLDWLSNPNNLIGNVTLPKECVENNLGSLRDAIDAAMELDAQGDYYKSFDNASDLIKHLKD